MFKIDNPEINNLNDILYSDIKNKEKIEQCNFINQNIYLKNSFDIKKCKFDGVTFDEVDIKFSNIEDVVFINCDLSNIKFIDTTMYRVKFINCKLLGTNFIDCDLNNIVIENCMCNLSNFASCKLKNIKLVESNFKESTFNTCSIKNMLIEDVNFSSSEIIDTPLKDIDFTTAKIDYIKLDLKSIKGMIINYYQAMDLVGLLGVKIK